MRKNVVPRIAARMVSREATVRLRFASPSFVLVPPYCQGPARTGKPVSEKEK
jgi:hypothetical protein